MAFAACKKDDDHSTPPPSGDFEEFEPNDGDVLVFAGQGFDAVGGLNDYSDGYADHFSIPAGVSVYTGVEGAGWLGGAIYSPTYEDAFLEDQDFDNSAYLIGFFIGENTEMEGVADGTHDDELKQFADWCISLGSRPIWLRVGYEFDAPWSGNDSDTYKAAFRRIRDLFEERGVTNVAYTFHSAGWDNVSIDLLESFYPGDEYVDWIGVSYFMHSMEVHARTVVDFARMKKKPLFMGEVSPILLDENNAWLPTDLSDSATAESLWEDFYLSFFSIIDDNPDVVKGFSYINHDWTQDPWWPQNTPFAHMDTRLQINEFLTGKWKEKMIEKKFIHAFDGLLECLNQQESL